MNHLPFQAAPYQPSLPITSAFTTVRLLVPRTHTSKTVGMRPRSIMRLSTTRSPPSAGVSALTAS